MKECAKDCTRWQFWSCVARFLGCSSDALVGWFCLVENGASWTKKAFVDRSRMASSSESLELLLLQVVSNFEKTVPDRDV